MEAAGEQFGRGPADRRGSAEAAEVLGQRQQVPAGLVEGLEGLVEEVRPFLDSVKISIDEIVREVYGG